MDAPGHHRYWQLAEPCHAFSAWAARSQASYGHRHPPGTKGSKEGHVQLLGVIEWKIMENLQDFMVSTHFYIVFLTHKSWSVGSFPLSFACSKFGSPKLDFEHQNKDSNQSMYVYYIISFFLYFYCFYISGDFTRNQDFNQPSLILDAIKFRPWGADIYLSQILLWAIKRLLVWKSEWSEIQKKRQKMNHDQPR